MSAPARHRRRWPRRLLGLLILLVLLFVIFQAVFAWAAPLSDALDAGAGALGEWVKAEMPASILRDFLTEGVIAGVGSVIVFLPQIIILFLFILIMEATGYMARAAFPIFSPSCGRTRTMTGAGCRASPSVLSRG